MGLRGDPTVVPRYSNGSPVHASSSVPTHSSITTPRLTQSLPCAAYSSERWPMPPSTVSRPALRMSITAMSSTTRNGSCNGSSNARIETSRARGARKDRGHAHEWRRAPPVRHPVVLFERHHGNAMLLRPLRHLDTGAISGVHLPRRRVRLGEGRRIIDVAMSPLSPAALAPAATVRSPSGAGVKRRSDESK